MSKKDSHLLLNDNQKLLLQSVDIITREWKNEQQNEAREFLRTYRF